MQMEIKTQLTHHPKTKPSIDQLGFGKYFTDHMFVMDYTGEKGWHNPVIVPYGPLDLEPSAMVFHYGQAVFEGLKAYKTDTGKILLFRPEKNFSRLNTSDERLCIPHLDEVFILYALKELIKVDADWVPATAGTSLYIRPFIISTEPALGVRPSDQYKFIIILSPVGSYYPQGINPIKIYIEDEYVRSVKGGIGFTKGAANYAISLKGQEKAKKMGYAQVLWLDGVERKYIEEVGTTNVFFIIKGELITPELNGSILPGVTRDSVIQLAKSWGMTVIERKISVQELFEAHASGVLDEAFASGTAAVISPIGEFNWAGNVITIADNKIGSVTKNLYDTITAIQYGKSEDKFDWVREII